MPTFRQTNTQYNPYKNLGSEQQANTDYVLDDLRPVPPPKGQTLKFGGDDRLRVHELQPALVPDGKPSQEEVDSPYGSSSHSELKRIGFHALRVLLVIGVVAVLLATPLWVLSDSRDINGSTADGPQRRNLIYWLFTWFLTVWIGGGAAHIGALVFPYAFWLIARFVNPAHRKYWRIFRPLKWPLTILGAVVVSWIFFEVLIILNDLVALNNAEDPTALATFESIEFIVDNIQQTCVFWALLYLIVKVLILYISIHYHYRSDNVRIEKSKAIVSALSELYETSIYLDPPYCNKFRDEDIIIRDAAAASGHKRKDALKFFQRIGGASNRVLSAFGTMMGSGSKSHWFKANSSYATVEYALEHPNSSVALAQRIWISLVAEGKNVLTVDDVAEAFGPGRKEEAQKCFKAIDENENGDIYLNEMVPMVVEAGKTRNAIYQGMQEINHAINTFEWILLIWIAAFMIFFILVSYVPTIQGIKDTLGLVGLGLSFAVGRIVNDFLQGANFVFFKHAYDISDVVELYNPSETSSVTGAVKRISLLYTIFERTDDGKEVQFPNERLNLKRIENLSRSGVGKEKIVLFVDINTPFKDLEFLREELKAYVSHPDNRRDYKPEVSLRIKSLHELNKMELAIMITHKSNWSNGGLKVARSSKFHCALMDAIRKVPINRPGPPPPKLGDEGKPQYMVVISDEEALQKRSADALTLRKKRFDFDEENEDLSGEEKEAKAARDKAAEDKARSTIAAIPTTLSGPKKDRPVTSQLSAFGNTSSTDFTQHGGRGSRQRRPGGGKSDAPF